MPTVPPESELRRVMQRDRHRLHRQLRALQRSGGPGKDLAERAAQMWEALRASQQQRAERAARAPAVRFDEDLPIDAHRQQIADAVEQRQVVVVCGETGSGKSTQLPKICLDSGRGIRGLIGHTQPRRIAARSIAVRLAEELGGRPVGHHVGYKVRFADQTEPGAYVKLMTDGMLLAETQSDRFLDQYDTIILDEAHERSLNIDFLLGYLKRLLPRRPDLRLIITSATIDVERFRNHFADGATSRSGGTPQLPPLIEVSGRTFPVEIRYRDQAEEDEEQEPTRALVDAVEEATGEGPGDILVFLPTEREIRDAARSLRGWMTAQRQRGIEILPLYARLSAAEQQKVFRGHAGRRIVLATNVAESSLTVPGIRFVIDQGLARMSRYAPRSKVQRLPIERVSQASAKQRAGRCGRIGPGICIRLYSQADFENRDAFTTPEIRRTNLAAVVLQTTALKLGAVEDFPFLDPPRPEAIRDAYKTLYELGAVDDARRLTDIGKRLSRLPVDPRIGRMVLAGEEFGCLTEMLIVASALEVQDPRDRPADKRQAADQAHAQFASPESDFVSLLKIWDFYHDLKQKLSRSQLRKALRQNFLSLPRLHEWFDVHRQLRQTVVASGRAVKHDRQDDYQRLHRALLTGLLSNVAVRAPGAAPGRAGRHEYQGAGGAFHLWPRIPLCAAQAEQQVRRPATTLPGRRGATVGDGCRAGRDVEAVPANRGADRRLVAGAGCGASCQTHLQRRALERSHRSGDDL